MLLDTRYDAALSCFAIASDAALVAFFGFLFFFTVGLVGVGAEYATAVNRAAWKKKHGVPAAVVLLVFLPLVSFFFFQSAYDGEKRKKLFVDGWNLVETGCVKLTEYRYEFPMKGVILTYEHDDIKGGNDYLRISAGARVLRVDLRHTNQRQNLSLFAPSVMKKYAAYLRQNGRVVPSEIADIP